MNLKESIKKDWRTDVGIIFFAIFLTSIIVAMLNSRPILIIIVYLVLVILSGFLGVASEVIDLFIFPFFPLVFWAQNNEQKKIKKYLSKVNQDIPKSAVVVLAYYDIYNIKYGMKPNYDFGNIKAIVNYLKISTRDDFSFYVKASRNDVDEIMADKNVREVLFVGHGDSHTFVLNLEDEIYYCDFNSPIYFKDFVHQVHCGTKGGKSLVDYIVPEENKSKCFFFRKTVRSADMNKWFKNRTKEITLLLNN
jgi:hypothetical protein